MELAERAVGGRARRPRSIRAPAAPTRRSGQWTVGSQLAGPARRPAPGMGRSMHRAIKAVMAYLVGSFCGTASTGCGHSCADVYFCADDPDGLGGDTWGSADCPDDPADGDVSPGCGVWVSAALGNDVNPGTQLLPVRTIGKAVALARGEPHKKGGPGRVYACGGADAGEIYDEAVDLPAGVSLHGGFACAHGWKYAGEEKLAVIAPSQPGRAPLSLTEGDDRQSLVTDLRMEAPDAVVPGGSSIGVFAHEGGLALLKRSWIYTGNGADGEDGAPASPDGSAAPSGLPGNDGAAACTTEPGAGGAQIVVFCDGATSTGAAGGDGGEQFANDGLPGSSLPSSLLPAQGEGGLGEDLMEGALCTAGSAGTQGAPGANGLGGKGNGRLTPEGYAGEPGTDGAVGLPGQGGGGGGGSAGNAVCGMLPHGGAGGGSGGTGGCGGKGGRGGKAGGSSIGVAARGATVYLSDCHVFTGDGGRGGDGGDGQTGGQAGLPGLGGVGFGGDGGVHSACAGGAGGNGGNGGGGGGGRGGHSVGTARTSDALVTWLTLPKIILGAPGSGGLGFGSQETHGQNGMPSDSVLLEP